MSKNEEFRINHKELCIQNKELCAKNKEFCINNDEFCRFLNAARGDGSLFVSSAELTEAWRIFTPLLHQIDEQ